ncbi:cytochrome P450 [Pseudomassariella vexata]|uniref:Cytochrome P450 n=1 Tax=Pseudomassariella vexata TaxID=1141098 RepID=A0A1Y2DQI9_9PEZI|nr:cytochrome P450 [Pseudomassariella vexata]ORY61477.1 cytochrome P450 [Pseudomassariella vexata]
MEFLKTLGQVQLVGIALLVGVVGYVYNVLRSPLNKVPGPWYASWTNIVTKYHFLTGCNPTYIHSLHSKYGPVVRIGPNDVDVADPVAAQTIHRIKDEFLKSEFYTQFLPGVTNIFNCVNRDHHRRYRRLLSSPLSETGLKPMLPQIDSRVRFGIQRMGEEMKSRGAVDICKWWMFMTTDIIGELTFGESFKMLELGRKNQYIKDLEGSAFIGGLRATFPLLSKLSFYVPIPFFWKAGPITGRLAMYSRDSIQRQRTLLEENPDMAPTLFSKMFKAKSEDSLSGVELEDNAQAYIVGGSDTTAMSLTYLVWAVCRDPQIKEKLVNELQTRLSDDFSYDDVKELPYLNQVIEETTRIYAAAPSGLPRTVPSGGASLAGYWIPGGATVLTQAYSLHRSEAFPDPERFDPSRWENPTKAMKDSMMPFGGGSRICLGVHLARIELRLATARFFRAFPNAIVSELEGMSDRDMDQDLFFLITPRGHRCLIQAN